MVKKKAPQETVGSEKPAQRIVALQVGGKDVPLDVGSMRVNAIKFNADGGIKKVVLKPAGNKGLEGSLPVSEGILAPSAQELEELKGKNNELAMENARLRGLHDGKAVSIKQYTSALGKIEASEDKLKAAARQIRQLESIIAEFRRSSFTLKDLQSLIKYANMKNGELKALDSGGRALHYLCLDAYAYLADYSYAPPEANYDVARVPGLLSRASEGNGGKELCLSEEFKIAPGTAYVSEKILENVMEVLFGSTVRQENVVAFAIKPKLSQFEIIVYGIRQDLETLGVLKIATSLLGGGIEHYGTGSLKVRVACSEAPGNAEAAKYSEEPFELRVKPPVRGKPRKEGVPEADGAQ